ncbi:MAG: beta-lactamase [Cyanobacteria bacterium RYN_339]|nr:beta-lactamase [Cyanobacteria bacterium RYN_339]
MARKDLRYPQNVDGVFYVDRKCIDCERCRRIAPEHFGWDEAGHSWVFSQPETPEAIAACERAKETCPVGAIGADGHLEGPPPIRQLLPGLFALGHPSPLTDDADAYLIVRPDGNVLVDLPAFHQDLLPQLQALGDLRYIFVTHEDTLGEVEDFQLHFGAEVIMHESEADQVQLAVAHAFTGTHAFADDLQVIHTPGHTRGSSCLLWRRHGGCLFVGDHLLPQGDALVPERFDWTYDWDLQQAQARALLAEPWNHAFPAHGAGELPRGFLPKAKARLEAALSSGVRTGA